MRLVTGDSEDVLRQSILLLSITTKHKMAGELRVSTPVLGPYDEGIRTRSARALHRPCFHSERNPILCSSQSPQNAEIGAKISAILREKGGKRLQFSPAISAPKRLNFCDFCGNFYTAGGYRIRKTLLRLSVLASREENKYSSGQT